MPVPGGVNWAAPWGDGGCLVPGTEPASLAPPRPSQAWVSFLMASGQPRSPRPTSECQPGLGLACAQGAGAGPELRREVTSGGWEAVSPGNGRCPVTTVCGWSEGSGVTRWPGGGREADPGH